MARSGRPWLIGDGTNRVSMVFIDSLIEGVGLALTRDRAAGQTYFLADARPYLWAEVFQAMGEAQQVQVRPRHLPAGLATVCHALDQWLARRGRYSMAVHVAGEATRHMACSIDKAAAELGYRPGVELREGMRQAVGWAREVGWL
jgi:nucleoside-diphosphate-sugar epimerase